MAGDELPSYYEELTDPTVWSRVAAFLRSYYADYANASLPMRSLAKHHHLVGSAALSLVYEGLGHGYEKAAFTTGLMLRCLSGGGTSSGRVRHHWEEVWEELDNDPEVAEVRTEYRRVGGLLIRRVTRVRGPILYAEYTFEHERRAPGLGRVFLVEQDDGMRLLDVPFVDILGDSRWRHPIDAP